ncbi:MAG: TIGR02757 family protein [Sedimentisphaerales bacterium]|nr:TIGR02757 family protein [Sedimentisphaerales bacterium]
MKIRRPAIKDVLERLYYKYNRRNLIKPDPLQFVYKYSKRADMEIAGLLSAVLAYGRVEQIQNSLTKLFSIIGESPYAFVKEFGPAHRKKLHVFKHRFTTGDDISDLLALLKIVLEQYGSIENYFISGYSKSDKNIIPALTIFCDSLSNRYAAKHNGHISNGLKYLLASPSRGSASKRLNLFLRWMVRDDQVDAGVWKSVDKAKLIVPVDVHMGRLCRIIGFHNNKTTTLKTAVKITENFAEMEPADPVKYDFALSRIGIVENCTGRYSPACEICELSSFCFQR